MGCHKKQSQKLNKAAFRQIRKDKDLTVEQLATAINYSYETVAQWTWKGRGLREDSKDALERFLGVDRTEFLI